jgi:hypothetical protein
MKSSQYNFVSITRAYNVVEAVMTTIALCFNKTLTVSILLMYPRWTFLSQVSRNTITPLVFTLIALFHMFNIFYSLRWYLKRDINGVTRMQNRTDINKNKISLLGQLDAYINLHTKTDQRFKQFICTV